MRNRVQRCHHWRTSWWLPVLLVAGTLLAGMAASPWLTLGGLLGIALSGVGVYAVGRWIEETARMGSVRLRAVMQQRVCEWSWAAGTPEPGSIGARHRGCTCPFYDNVAREGVREHEWWITEGCPLHDAAKETEE